MTQILICAFVASVSGIGAGYWIGFHYGLMSRSDSGVGSIRNPQESSHE